MARLTLQRLVSGRGWPLLVPAARLVGSLWVLVTASFLMMHLVPGDPVRDALGPSAPESLVAARRAALGLNRSLPAQYLQYLHNLLHGNMGVSIQSGLPVADVVRQQLPYSFEIALLAFALVLLVAIPLGIVLAALTKGNRRQSLEVTFTTATVLLFTVPSYLLAEALVFVFSVKLQWLPIAGDNGPSSYVLPVVSLAVGPIAILARVVRIEVLSVLQSEYIRTARSKRLPGWRIYLIDALPNAITATLTIGGLMLSGLIAGTVLVESVFSWPGLGTTLVSSIQGKDYSMVQAVVIIYGGGVLLINTLVDMLLAVIDPRTARTAS